MNKNLKLGLLPLFALGACAQPQAGAQGEAAAPTVAVAGSEEAVFRTVDLSVTGMR